MSLVLRAFRAQAKELKHVRLHGKIVGFLDGALKGMQVVMRNLNALNVSA